MSAYSEKRGVRVPLTNEHKSPIPDIWGLGGALAGLGGGIAMALVGLFLALATGADVWAAPKLIAGALGGSPTVAAGFEAGPVVLGTIMHLAFSMGMGALFGIVFRRIFRLPSSFGVPIVSGLVYGLAIWFVAYFMVLPILNSGLLQVYAPGFVIQNLTYGVVLGLIYSYLRP
jgi:hypothetical protein